ncbi:1-acyl-sn-glycerol-3-phosphate acyltransferase [Flavobacterium sp. UBA6135]|uniref:1-acyl-sn-glycerol-3-phosphate acyltransferase n=1 Tax=Flavobacterium sp. UBA6135 TaxID=1946553 RepID=UPI0025BC1745|nr:1-acyl-sn-glycerol-3-phosphate acyltransferase [Flavobacterium sp. UBA6135]
MKKRLSQFILFKVMGWKIEGTLDPAIKKCVIIVVPHTSWHDFYIGLFIRSYLGIEINFVGKKELFQFPFGFYFRWLGGAPLDRTGGLNKVDAIAKVFANRETFRLAIAPEGTRKKVIKWKTGFYYISLQANVPIIPVAFDFSKKQITINKPYDPTGEIEVDMPILEHYFKGVVGKYPENSFLF